MSAATDGEICVWNGRDGSALAEVPSESPFRNPTTEAIALLASAPLPSFQTDSILAEPVACRVTPDVSSPSKATAKVVFLGRSETGKSCLARRLATDECESLPSTHGMQLWSIPIQKLDPARAVPGNETREVALWDLAASPTISLSTKLSCPRHKPLSYLFDPTRDTVPLEDVEADDRLRRACPEVSALRALLAATSEFHGSSTSQVRSVRCFSAPGLNNLSVIGASRAPWEDTQKRPREPTRSQTPTSVSAWINTTL